MKYILSLPKGVRQIVLCITLLYLTTLALSFFNVVDLYAWLGLNAPAVWRGHLWQFFTYWLLPSSCLAFVLNTLFFVMFAPRLEKEWSCAELWTFCFIGGLASGLFDIAFRPHSSGIHCDLMGVNFGLLVAWVKFYSNDEVYFYGEVKMPVRVMAAIVVTISFLISYPNLLGVLACVSGAGLVWVYLTIKSKIHSSRSAQAHSSKRISRLEL